MLKARVLTALALVAGFLSVLFLLPKPAAVVVFALVAGLAGWEWGGLIGAGRSGRNLFVGLVLLSCLGAYLLPGQAFPLLWLISAVLWLVLVPVWLVRRWSLDGRKGIGYLVGWILVVPTWAAMAALHERSPWLLLAAMALVWVADTGAYFTGRALGRHKLAPAISPGKTWEGVAGGVAGVLIYGFSTALGSHGLPAQPLSWGLFLVLLAAVSVVGDLFESLIKRQAGVKDSGSLLPGHGGILDRIDSQTSTLPLVALVVHWMQV